MEKEQVSPESGFSLFDQEERVLQSAASMIGMLENVAGGVRELADAYGQSYREQRRLLRISDRLQLDLHQANHTLASQAEELKQLNGALQNEIDLREALAEELRLLNENLEQRVKSEVVKGREQEYLLIQQSRHAVLGEMIGNITHQWRQPLFALSLIVQGIESEQQDNVLDVPSLEEHLNSANRVIRQMNETIDDFLNFFRPNKKISAFGLKEAVQNAWQLVQSSMNFRLQFIDEAIEEVFASGFSNEFSQVLINIFANAKDAIREREVSPGRVEIRIGQDARRAWVDIRDNAGGIPDAVLDKVFDAYFTTREKGTGIGLYMSRIIMRNMGGDIEARNVGNGAEFRVILPKADGADPV
jgi:signal transduction histidine kinase